MSRIATSGTKFGTGPVDVIVRSSVPSCSASIDSALGAQCARIESLDLVAAAGALASTSRAKVSIATP